MIPIAFSVCLFLLASSSIPELSPHSVAVRVVGLAVLQGAALWRRRLPEYSSPRRLVAAATTVGIGFSTYLGASALAHGMIADFLIGLVSLVLVLAEVAVLFGYYATPQITNGVYLALLAVCAASLLMYQLAPDVAIEDSRLRGILENANGLGFVAFALGAASLAARRRLMGCIIGLVVALTCLFLSASRASLLALAVAALVLAVNGSRRARTTLAIGILGLTVLWLVAPGVLATSALFRTDDTRSAGLEVLAQAMSQSLWTGLGELPAGTMVAGSPVAAGVTGGILGLVGLGLIYLGLLRGFWLCRPHALALVWAGLAHSLFESWMLSFAAPMLLTFSVVLVAFVKLDESGPERLHGRRPDRARRVGRASSPDRPAIGERRSSKLRHASAAITRRGTRVRSGHSSRSTPR